AAGALLVDRDRMRARMHHAALAGRVDLSDLGPRLGFRWWRFTAGVMLGLALGVKWSGLYFIAFFGIMTVAWDWALRSRYGVRRPLAGALVRDAPPARSEERRVGKEWRWGRGRQNGRGRARTC